MGGFLENKCCHHTHHKSRKEIKYEPANKGLPRKSKKGNADDQKRNQRKTNRRRLGKNGVKYLIGKRLKGKKTSGGERCVLHPPEVHHWDNRKRGRGETKEEKCGQSHIETNKKRRKKNRED